MTWEWTTIDNTFAYFKCSRKCVVSYCCSGKNETCMQCLLIMRGSPLYIYRIVAFILLRYRLSIILKLKGNIKKIYRAVSKLLAYLFT